MYFVILLKNYNNNIHLKALYPSGPSTSTIYHPYCPQIPHKHSQPSLPGLLVHL